MDQINNISIKTWIAFICMVFGMFMAVLDIQIVASSLKEIQAGLSATQDEINWIQSAYLIAEVVIIPLSGWLTRAFSTRIIFAISCAGFTLMSLACAMAWNLNSMIVFRVLQGFFGGSMIPTVFATIFTVFPFKMRSMVTVVIGLVVTIAPISGPIIGGYITDYLSWHYLFLLNVVPGILVTFFVLKLVDFDQPQYELLKNIDFIGVILVTISLGVFQYILEEGAKENWLESDLIKRLSIISLISFSLMIYRELKIKDPIIDLRAFRDLNFACSCVLSFVLGWGLYTAVFILPMYLGYVKNLNSLQIGEYLCVMGAFQLLSAPCAGLLSKKIDLRIMLVMGLFLFGIGLLMNYNITYDSAFKEFFLPQAVRGFALMFCFVPITSLAYATLPVSEVKTASGLYSLMRNLGGAIGLAVTNNWLQVWSKRNYLSFRENIDATNNLSNQEIELLEHNFLNFDVVDPTLSAIKIVYNIAQREAYIITFNQICVHISIFFFMSAITVFFIKKAKD